MKPSGCHPFDGTADQLRRPGDHSLLAVVELLDAEATTHIGRHHAHFLLGNLEHQGAHQESHNMRKLTRSPQRIVAGPAVVLGDRRARFHRVADQSIVDEAKTRHMRGLLERRRNGGLVAELPVAAEIVRNVVEQLRCARTNGFEHADDGW